jgi:hypothetical protein
MYPNDNYTRYEKDPKVDDLDGEQGLAETEEKFALDLPDNEIVDVLDKKINNSRAFWNNQSSFNLKGRRERNNRFVTGDQWYEFGNVGVLPYVQNEIFTAEQVVTAYVTAQIPEVEVMPAQDTPESRRLAQSVSALLKYHSEYHDLQGILTNVVMSILNNYIGLLELEYDPNCGEFGDIIPSYLDPSNTIVDKRAKQGKNPAFFSITLQNTAEELIAKFPKSKDKITNKVQGKLQSNITWRKVWVTVYIKGRPQEGFVGYFEDVVMTKNKTPHWIYDEDVEGVKNYLDEPAKPIIPFNYINDGTHWIDRYGPIDQTIPLQVQINKIGRQIQKGIAHASPVLVFNKKALPKPAADQVTGEPWEKILVDAEDVNRAYGVIQANQVPAFVINEIDRLAASLHEIFGTPPQLRGENNQSQTATQDLMARNQAQGRQDLLVRSVDRGLDRYFKQLLQMMKVYYTEDHFASILGEDGRYTSVMLNREDIEDGIQIKVKAGSTLPMDKSRLEQVALELAKMGKISLLSLYEFLDVPNPGKHVERVIKEQVDPVTTVEDIKHDDADGNAIEDYEIIKAGQEARLRDDVDARYIKTMKKQLLSEDFKMWPVENQQVYIDFLDQSIQKAMALNDLTQEDITPTPVPEPDPGIPLSLEGQPTEGVPAQGSPEVAPPPAPLPAPEAPPAVPPPALPPVM